MKLGIFSPGSAPGAEALEKGLAWLAAHGFTAILPERLVVGEDLHAGAAEARAADLHRLLRDPEVEAILCARGGTGTLGLLPHADYALFRAAGKPIIGMSDVTALHLALLARAGLPGISGQMGGQLSAEMPGGAPEGWLSLVRGPFPLGPVPLPEGTRLEILAGRPQDVEGILLPCNLSLLASLVGTPYLPPLRGTLPVLEDIHETPQSIDRLLSQLSLSGVMEGVRGLVLGQFTECRLRGRETGEGLSHGLLREWARTLGVPVLGGFPYGHEASSCALPVGTPARITWDPPALHLLGGFGRAFARGRTGGAS
jgi:muramoyltetrapeptide carboxypeptidase